MVVSAFRIAGTVLFSNENLRTGETEVPGCETEAVRNKADF